MKNGTSRDMASSTGGTVNAFSRVFIDRPVLGAVLSIAIVLIGGLAYFSLPVAQYPEVAPPTVVVTAFYPGATPDVLSKTVATPLEQEINGVENMLYVSSICSSDGQVRTTVTFKLGTNLDDAQVLVQNRVAIAEPRLPEETRRIGVTTIKASPDLLMVIHMVSPDDRYDQLYISNYAYINVVEPLRRIDGVGAVSVLGGREFAMRIWLDADKLAALDLTAGDVVGALREQNVQVAAGSLGQAPLSEPGAFQYNVSTLGRLEDTEEFGNIVVRSEEARVVKLQDVARIELGARDYSINSYLDSKPAVALVIQQRPGSNALATADALKAAVKTLSGKFPPGLEYRVIYNPTVFISESVSAVLHTIVEAVILVVLVVMVFLQTWRATLIPLVAIPVSLVGTFAVMAALGFSLNNLSLFGLVLAIGIVVDDAIVVVENIERNLELGLEPKEAARKAMDEVGGAVVAIALVLSAVFIPTAFIPGISGQFYRQFALTIAVSTLISAFVSLTLSPALGATLLKKPGEAKDWFTRGWNFSLGWFFRGFNRFFERTSRGYRNAAGLMVRRTAISLLIYGGLLALTFLGFQRVPGGFIPVVDQAYAIVIIQLPDSASLSRTDGVVRQVSDIVRQAPGVTNAVGFAGFSGATQTVNPSHGVVFTPFAPFDERVKGGHTGALIIADLRKRLSVVKDARIIVIPPPSVRGMGNGGGFKMEVQDLRDQGPRALQGATGQIIAAAQNEPSVTQVFSALRANTPQYFADVDRVKARMLDVPLSNVFETLQIYLGSLFVNEFNRFGRVYRVTAQAEEDFRRGPENVSRLRARNIHGQSVPLGSIVHMKPIGAPDAVNRYNLYAAAEIQGDTAPGASSGEALSAMERIARQVLPAGYQFEWTEIAYQQRTAGNLALLIFPLCVVFVYLVLAALYESWSLPLAIVLTVPMCLFGGIAAIWLSGNDNNILSQIGFVVLVSLACKNAILIVEFPRQLEEQGRSLIEATLEACRLRLRPILMTSLAFILGVVPLVIATGAGAELRRALGVAVFGGMIGVTFFGLFFTPVFYVIIRKLTGADVCPKAPKHSLGRRPCWEMEKAEATRFNVSGRGRAQDGDQARPLSREILPSYVEAKPDQPIGTHKL